MLTSPRSMLTLLLLPMLVVRLLLLVRLAELPLAVARLPPPPERLLLDTELLAWRPPWLPPPPPPRLALAPPPPPRPPPPRCAIASLAHSANTQEETSRPATNGLASALRIGLSSRLAITFLPPGILQAA